MKISMKELKELANEKITTIDANGIGSKVDVRDIEPAEAYKQYFKTTVEKEMSL